MNPKDLVPAEGAKSWLVITAVVILLSGFFLFNAIQAKNREQKLRIQKEQELSLKLNELVQAQTDLTELKKQKEQSEQALTAQLAELQASLDETRKNEEKSRTKLQSLQKDKDQLASLVDQNAAMIAKLNKKIEKLEQEKEDLRGELKRASASQGSAYPASQTASNTELSSAGAEGAPTPDTEGLPQTTEVVDLGQIVLHGESREPARVEHVNTMYGFIVVSAGSDDGLRTDTVLNVARNNRFIAKAVVKKVRSSVATAVLLPEWTREEIRLGDQISINPLEIPKESPKRRVADLLPR
jgi:peptidoglycan hydrolase CwlO-like protein